MVPCVPSKLIRNKLIILKNNKIRKLYNKSYSLLYITTSKIVNNNTNLYTLFNNSTILLDLLNNSYFK